MAFYNLGLRSRLKAVQAYLTARTLAHNRKLQASLLSLKSEHEFMEHGKSTIFSAIDRGIVSAEAIRAIRAGAYEEVEAHILPQIIDPTDRILELGAGIGFISTVISTRIKPDYYVAVEANPSLLPLIELSHEINGVSSVKIINAVATNDARILQEGHVNFKVEEQFVESRAIQSSANGDDIIAVPAISLNELLVQNSINVIIVDIEGGEAELFDGADLSGVRLVTLEIHPHIIGEAGVRKVFQDLHGAGLVFDYTKSYQTSLSFSRY